MTQEEQIATGRRMTAQSAQDRADFMEKHFTLSELSKAWHLSQRTLKAWFDGTPGVIRYGPDKLTKGRKRTYVTLRVPESVARRVYRTRTGREG
jgi:hypothetical protein